MNKKAEAFIKYLEDKSLNDFAWEEVKDDPQNTVIFRSHLVVEGQQLPLIVLLDDSVFGVVRVLVSPKALNEENSAALYKLVNEENKRYKPFKLYLDDAGSLLMDLCLMAEPSADGKGDNGFKGDNLYGVFNVILQYLNGSYRNLMKTIW